MFTTGRTYLVTKRIFDFVVSAVLLFLLIAVAIYLDTGLPILLAAERTGRDGKRFRMLKFRTMVANAEELKAELAHLNVLPAPDFKIPNDPRITRIGRFLRRTSLDELPQLINVLKGDMALVGPRPTSFDVSTYQLWHTGRLEFRPGVTGPWQVLGRDSMDFDERCRLEISFFRHPSIWAELKLLLATVP